MRGGLNEFDMCFFELSCILIVFCDRFKFYNNLVKFVLFQIWVYILKFFFFVGLYYL